jgi:hypothetical protein
MVKSERVGVAIYPVPNTPRISLRDAEDVKIFRMAWPLDWIVGASLAPTDNSRALCCRKPIRHSKQLYEEIFAPPNFARLQLEGPVLRHLIRQMRKMGGR